MRMRDVVSFLRGFFISVKHYFVSFTKILFRSVVLALGMMRFVFWLLYLFYIKIKGLRYAWTKDESKVGVSVVLPAFAFLILPERYEKQA